MGNVASLAKDTAIYGISSIVGRFLNWCLVPLYTNIFSADAYGVVTYVYSFVALAMIILTYGMETGFFRFANHRRWNDPMQVYSTSLVSLATSGSLFFVTVLLFLDPLARWMECGTHTSWVWVMALCVALDAFTALPFCYLRFRNQPMRFAVIKLVNIGLNIGLNIFFLIVCPWLNAQSPGIMDWCYSPDYGVGYVFLSNLLASAVTLLMLWPQLNGFRWNFCFRLWKEMIVYSAPLLVLGVAGIMNQTLDKILLPSLSTAADPMQELGIYGANYKIAIVMVMFIQAFRFAYEPFIFAQNKESGADANKAYSSAMKYFVITALFIFVAVMFYLPVLKYFISPRYFSGLDVVPVVMAAELCFGIFFNLSVWYKLSDKTVWGMWFSLGGLAVTVIMNILLVPRYGYMGCAWAALSCYALMMLSSYVIGRIKYPIAYPIGRMGLWTLFSAALYVLGLYVLDFSEMMINYVVRALLLAVFVAAVAKYEGLSFDSLVRPILKKIKRK